MQKTRLLLLLVLLVLFAGLQQLPAPEVQRRRIVSRETGLRQDCNAIMNTAFRSADERAWFEQNCSRWPAVPLAVAAGASASKVRPPGNASSGPSRATRRTAPPSAVSPTPQRSSASGSSPTASARFPLLHLLAHRCSRAVQRPVLPAPRCRLPRPATLPPATWCAATQHLQTPRGAGITYCTCVKRRTERRDR